MITTLLLILICGMITIGILLILPELKTKKGGSKQFRLFVNDGVDVDTLSFCMEKAEAFRLYSDPGTILSNGQQQSMWQLFLKSVESGQELSASFHQNIILGREPQHYGSREVLILTGDNGISREHCMIYANGNGLSLRDLQEKNRSRINGVLTKGDVVLREGDILQMGRSRFIVNYRLL